jgi:hypothetical protein
MNILFRHIRNSFLIGIFILIGCADYLSQSFVKEILGLEIVIEKKIFSFEESLNPSGEGFSFNQYKLYNINKCNIEKDGYPMKREFRKEWKIQEWQSSNLIKEEDLELIFNYRIQDDSMKKVINSFRESIKLDGNIISYYYKEDSGYIYSIHLFFLDYKNNELLIFEIIT